MKKLLFLFAAVMAWMLPASAGNITDVITAQALGVTGTNSYGNYTDVSISSTAVYSANCAQNDAGAIQLRSNNNNSGIVSTTSGGTVKTVTITWNSGTAAGRAVQVYGSNAAYTAASALYGADKGTLIAEVKIDDANNGVSIVTVTDEYEYVGIRSKNGALYLTSVAVEWETAGGVVVAKPTFSPAAGEVKAGTEVSLSCSTDDAAIYYTTDGTAPTSASTAYAAPIIVNDDVTIKAIAYVGTTASAVATASYTVLTTIEDLNALSDAENNAQFVVGMDLNVVYANGQYNYVYDGTSYGLVYKDIAATAGQKIEAGWKAKMSIYKNLPEIVPLETVSLVAGGTVPEPVEVTSDDAADVLSANNVNQYFCLMGVEIEDFGTGSTFTGMMDDTEVTFYKRFTTGVEYPEAGVYNVIGFVSIFDTTIQFFPIEFIDAAPTIDSFNAMSDLEEGMFVTVGMPVTVVDTRLEEFIIVWDGQRYGSVFLEDVELQPGDVLSAGWTAMYTLSELVALDPESVEVTAGGTVPVTPDFGAEDLAQSQYDWSYATLTGVVVEDEVEGWDLGMGVAIDGDTEAPLMFMNYLDPEDGDITIEAGAYNMTGVWVPGWILTPASNAKIKKPLKEDSEFPAYIFMVLGIEEAEDDMPVIEALTAVSDIENNEIVKVGMPLTVAAVTEVVTIVYDGQGFGAIAYYGAEELAPGDVIEAGWIASVYEGVLMAGGEITLGEATEAPAPIVITGDDLDQSMYPWSYLTVQNVLLFDDFEGFDVLYAFNEDGDLVPFYAASFDGETIDAALYNMTGFWMPIEFMMGMSDDDDVIEPSEEYLFIITGYEPANNDPEVESLTALADFEPMQHFTVGCPLTCIYYGDGAGVFTDGVCNIMLAVDGNYQPGDVLATGWSAVYMGPGIAGCFCLSDEAPEVTGTAEVPAPAECPAEDITTQQVKDLNYVKLLNAYAYDEEVELCEMIDGEELNVFVGETEQVETVVINYFGVEMPTKEGRYDIVGFWATFDNGGIAPYDEEAEEDAFYFFIPVSFDYKGSTDGVESIELEGNATYYDINGVRVANPRAGKAYIRVNGGKAVKIVK